MKYNLATAASLGKLIVSLLYYPFYVLPNLAWHLHSSRCLTWWHEPTLIPEGSKLLVNMSLYGL